MIEARPMDRTIPFKGGTGLNNYRGNKRDKRPMPTQSGLAYSDITMESIYVAPERERVQEILFGDLPIDTQKHEAISKNPRQDIARRMTAFASRAFRRPVTQKEIAAYVSIAHDDLSAGLSFTDALKGGYRALLCSPRFLYFNEAPGKLDDHAIATRLSYFLWSSMPDAQLLKAAQGQGPHHRFGRPVAEPA
jgi:hypothetical protein